MSEFAFGLVAVGGERGRWPRWCPAHLRHGRKVNGRPGTHYEGKRGSDRVTLWNR